jgi:hypothetical protein
MDANIADEVNDAWLDLLDDKSATAWLLAGYEGKNIILKQKGEGGRSECLAAIPDDTQLFFGAFKLNAIDNRGSTISKRPKFVIFFYRAANAPSMAKAKAGRHMGAIEQAFHGYHVMFQIDELHELSESEVVKKLRASGGAHQPTGYDFGYGDVGEGAEEAAPEKAAVANPADAAPLHVKAPKPEQEGAMRKLQYTTKGAEPGAVDGGAAEAATAPDTSGVVSTMAAVKIDEKPETNANGVSVIMLMTSMPSTTVIEGNQITLRNILNGRLKFKVTEIDGVLPENKEARSAMFECGKRGAYPQVFLKDSAGAFTSIGDFDDIQSLNDTDSLPPDILEANPQIPTFKKAFADFL